ncbi:hypothetical protein ACFQ3S_18770 [Mucilaginibacter terrae]|uniref:hypothetical protein n=1 Tax=Mucilaginibacter terrae TaxID=1955052 RepID=UPI003634F145
MPEVTIKYKKPETLKILKGLGKYLDFIVSTKKKTPVEAIAATEVPEQETYKIGNATVIRGDRSIDTTDLGEIFTRNNIDAAQLRKKAWERNK